MNEREINELFELREELMRNFNMELADWVLENSDYVNDIIQEETESILNNSDLKELKEIKRELLEKRRSVR